MNRGSVPPHAQANQPIILASPVSGFLSKISGTSEKSIFIETVMGNRLPIQRHPNVLDTISYGCAMNLAKPDLSISLSKKNVILSHVLYVHFEATRVSKPSLKNRILL